MKPPAFLGKSGRKSPSLVLVFLLALAVISALPLPAAHSDVVVATIPVGAEPYAVAVNPVTNKIYVANTGSDSVSVIDGNTNTVTSTIPVGYPPECITVNPITNMIYVCEAYGDIYKKVSVISGSTDAVVGMMTLPNGGGATGVAVNPDTNLIYVSDAASAVYVFNSTTDALLYTIPFGFRERPWSGIVLNPKTEMVYVPTWCSFCPPSYVAVIDGHTNTRVMNIPLGGTPSGGDINLDTNMIYVTDAGNWQLRVINGSSNSRAAAITFQTGAPGGVGVNPKTNLLYVTVGRDVSTYVISGSTNNIVDLIPVGLGAAGVAVNPNTNRIYVTKNGDNTVLVIDGNTPPSISASTSTTTTSITSTATTTSSSGTSSSSTTTTSTTTAITSTTTATGTSQITVNTQDTTGAVLTGYWAQLYQYGATVASGYTPATFTLVNGQTYTVEADGYGSCAFAYWLDTGSTDNQRAISITSDTSLTAVLKCSS